MWTNIYHSFYLQDGGKKSTGMDMEQNYVTVTVCTVSSLPSDIILSLSLSATAVTHTYAMEANLCSASYVSRQSRDTARLCCCGAVAAGRRSWSNRSISPAYRAHSSKPAARCCSVDSWYRQTDRRTDTSPLHRPCCIHTMRAVSISIQSH